MTTHVSSKRMSNQDEISQFLTQLTVVQGHCFSPFFHIVKNIVYTLLGTKILFEVLWSTRTTHANIIKENKVKMLLQILHDQATESRRSSKPMFMYQNRTVRLPFTSNYRSYIDSLILKFPDLDIDLKHSHKVLILTVFLPVASIIIRYSLTLNTSILYAIIVYPLIVALIKHLALQNIEILLIYIVLRVNASHQTLKQSNYILFRLGTDYVIGKQFSIFI